MTSIEQRAKAIANAVTDTRTEERHLLYAMVAVELAKMSQFFQATHFRLLNAREQNGG